MGVAQSNSRSSSRELLPVNNQVMDVLDPADVTPRRGRKRKAVTESAAEMKKVAKLNTCAYVYEKLFEQGINSDIIVAACGREWKVHKIYLKQTKFFESMFDGSWEESNSERIDMEITDPNINADGLNAVLGSLYHNEIEIDLEKIEGTIAAASYIVLESVTERCAEMMIENLNIDNAIRFLELSTRYGLDDVREKSMKLLLQNFWRIMTNRDKLREIEQDLLIVLLDSPNLLVSEGEYDVYKAVKSWIYMRECPNCRMNESVDVFASSISKFLAESEPDYLLFKYFEVLSSVRIENTLLSTETIKVLKTDCLIPKSIIDEMTSDLWISFLENEENPKVLDISDDDFYQRCFRLGRSLESVPKCWRWTGFNSGVDLLLHLNDYSVCIKRNCLNQKAPYSVNLKSKHILHYRLIVCDSNGRIIQDSGKSKWEMGPDESKIIFRLNEETQSPLSVHFQFMIHSPIDRTSHYLKKYLNEKEATVDVEDDKK